MAGEASGLQVGACEVAQKPRSCVGSK